MLEITAVSDSGYIYRSKIVQSWARLRDLGKLNTVKPSLPSIANRKCRPGVDSIHGTMKVSLAAAEFGIQQLREVRAYEKRLKV